MKKPMPKKTRAASATELMALSHEAWPFYCVTRLVGLYQTRLNAALKPLAMDVTRWRILAFVSERPGATISATADEAVMQLSTIAKTVQRMVAQGLLSTRRSETDARSIEVFITDEGRALFDDVKAKAVFITKIAFEDVAGDELRSMIETIAKVHRNLST